MTAVSSSVGGGCEPEAVAEGDEVVDAVNPLAEISSASRGPSTTVRSAREHGRDGCVEEAERDADLAVCGLAGLLLERRPRILVPVEEDESAVEGLQRTEHHRAVAADHDRDVVGVPGVAHRGPHVDDHAHERRLGADAILTTNRRGTVDGHGHVTETDGGRRERDPALGAVRVERDVDVSNSHVLTLPRCRDTPHPPPPKWRLAATDCSATAS